MNPLNSPLTATAFEYACSHHPGRESIVFMFDQQLPTGPRSTFEVITVRGKDRFQTLQYAVEDEFTGYTLIHQTRVDEA
jgi:hypothetical protein